MTQSNVYGTHRWEIKPLGRKSRAIATLEKRSSKGSLPVATPINSFQRLDSVCGSVDVETGRARSRRVGAEVQSWRRSYP